MNRIDQTFKILRENKRKAFIAFLTAGDPDLTTTEQLVLALEKVGVDLIELGVPFSDPMADGPTIQASSKRALENGTTLHNILKLVERIRQQSRIPIILMTYYNPVFHFGDEKFVLAAVQSGVDGVVIPDLPPQEATHLRHYAHKHGLATIFFVAPTTTEQRLKTIIQASTGFIYYVSLTGVTGARVGLSLNVARDIKKLKRLTDKPVCVGFGISTPTDVRSAGQWADGVIIGSAIVKEIEKNTKHSRLIEHVAQYVSTLVQALR